MKRRVLSFLLTLALCLNLCPVGALAADAGTEVGLCPHHPAHTDECGYAMPVPEQECTHSHDESCNTDGAACTHEHDDTCGYAAGDPGAPCAFVCRICPIEDLLGALPDSLSEDNSEQVQDQLSEIFALYEELTEDEQAQVDLSSCLALLEQIDGLGAAVLDNGNDGDYIMTRDMSQATPYQVVKPKQFDTKGFTWRGTGTGDNSSAIQVTGTGVLDLMGSRGSVISDKGVGVEVQTGGSLNVKGPSLTIQGKSSYALYIASGAKVQLYAGTYIGLGAAIYTEDDDFAALLAPGYAYCGEDGQILPSTMKNVSMVIIQQCTKHAKGSYTHDAGTTTHTWTCDYCGTKGSEKCTFNFDENGTGTCELCNSKLTITVDETGLADLVYDGTLKPGSPPPITVTLTDGSNKELVKDTDYEVIYEPRTDVGEITVTVTGKTFNGTFTKTYQVKQDEPGIEWDATTKELDYDDQRTTVEEELPHITITIKAPNNEDLHPYLQYAYRKTGETEFTPGLPLDAGTYEIKAYLEESQNYTAAETDPLLTLTINKIPAVITAPTAKTLTYNREAQELVTAGVLEPGAIAEGAKIEFAQTQNGPYSTEIPTGTGVSNYTVWYRVLETANYTGQSGQLNARINHRQITPKVELSYYTILYTGGEMEPAVTVKDGEYVIPNSEYTVTYANNRNVGTATVTVSNANNGNYKLNTATAEFKITLRTQETLSITQKPNTVIYGDQFTLGTQGGSGNGLVTWAITDGAGVATVNSSGQVTIIGDGSATVKATKSGQDPVTNVTNYEDATTTWTLTAAKKPVTATVTADDKTYNGDNVATVHAVVNEGVLPGDVITITGLTGTFDNENAGADKPVIVVTSGAQITGNNSQHYAVSYSAAPVTATIHKAVAKITTAPVPATLTYNGTEQALIGTAAVVDPSGVPVEYALSESGPYSTNFPKGTNAGDYTVWYRVQETTNYTGLAPASVPVTISKKSVQPEITLSQDIYVYDGTAKEPVVTLTEADGTTVIPADEYTVDYSGNVNVGTATVTVTAKADGNYTFTNAPVTKDFTINKEQARVTTAPEAAGEPLTFNTRAQKLVTPGAGTGGTMVYRVGDSGDFSADIPTGLNAGNYTVHYKVRGDANHSDSEVGSVNVTIAPKTVKDPTIELYENNAPLVSYTYDGSAKKPSVKVIDGDAEIGVSEYNIIYSDNVDAGKSTVSITDKPNGNYTVTGSANFVITKANIVFNPTPSAANITYDGKPHELLTPGTTSGGEVLYALNSATSTYAAAIPTGVEAGDYTVYYKVVGDKNHNDFAVQSVPVTIKRKPLTAVNIVLTPDTFVYDGLVKMPEVAVQDGKTVLPEEEYSWVCSDSSPTNEGTYTITISDAANGNYDLTGLTGSAAEATFTIGQSAQADLVIEGKPNSTIYGDTFTLTTSGGSVSGAAVTWEVVTGTDAATVDINGNVTITGVGDVTIKATNPGDQNYMPVSDQWTFTAAPKPVTASVTVGNKVYDGTTAATVTAANITTINSDTVTIKEDSIIAAFDTATVGTGKTVTLDTSNVQVTGGDADKYAITYPASVKADITVKQITTLTIELTDIDLKTDDTDGSYYYDYDGTAKTPAVTVKGNDGKVIPDSEYTVNYSGHKNVGTATVTVTAKADGNYKFDEATVNFTIRSAAAKLTSSPLPKDLTYEKGTEHELVTVGTATGGTVVYALKNGDTEPEDTSYSESIPKGENAGTYTVYYKVQGDANHTSTAPQPVSVIIKRREFTPTITLNPTSFEYDGTAKTPTVTVYDSTVEITDTNEYTVSFRDNINAGTATVTVSDNSGGNYIVNGTATFQITRKAPAVTAPTAKTGLQYSGELQELVTAGVCNEGTIEYSVNGGSFTTAVPAASAVGDYEIKYKVTGDANHSDVAPVSLGNVEIVKNTVTNPTITLSSDQFTYNGNQQKPVITVKDDSSRLIPETEYTVTIEGTNGNVGMVNVDTYTVTITTPDSSNYVINSNNTRTFEIVAADQETISITGAKAQVRYGEEIQLGVTGGIGGSTVKWEITGNSATTLTQGGLLTVKDVNTTIKVTATRSAGDNYKEVSATWEFTAGKKPVTAVLTADDRNYIAGDTSATVHASVPNSELVSGDSITIGDLTGTFDNDNVGTGKKVTVNNASPNVTGTNADKYDITYPATTTASILAVAAEVTTEPTAKTSLTYDASQSQELVTAGTATGGTMVYSLDGTNFTPGIPKAKDAGTYKVWFKAQGDQNHTDSAAKSVDVTIAQQPVTPQIELTPPSAQYDGQVKRPEVVVRDTANNVIPESEYTVVYDPDANWKNVGNHKVTVKNVTGGNYIITDTDATFVISATAQNPLEIVNKPGLVHYGDTFTLSATGGSSTKKVTWSSSDGTIADVDENGLVTIKGTGSATITATKPSDGNYEEATATYPLNALKKPVTAIVSADDRVYASGDTSATIHITWKDGDLVGTDTINTDALTGEFENADVGTNKKVTIKGTRPTSDKYEITIPDTTTASILKADKTAPTLTANNRTYDGTTQALVTGGDADTRYSDTRDGVYSATVPTETNAGTYTVWYKELGDANHNESEPQGVEVTISRKTLTADSSNTTLTGNGLQKDASGYYYQYDGTEKKPTVIIKDGSATVPASEYTVSYSSNQDVGDATVTITNAENGNYDVSGSLKFAIRKGSAQLTTSPEGKTLTYTGQPQELVNVGTVTGGHIEYALKEGEAEPAYSTTIPKKTDAGTYVVYYKVVGDENHTGNTEAGSVTATISPKTVVSPVVTVSGSYTYDGNAKEPGSTNVKVEDGATVIPDSEYSLSYQDNVDAGTSTVVVTNANGGNYIVNGTGTFEILKIAPMFTAPTGKTGLKYNGTAQELVTAGSASGGTMVYSLEENGDYSPAIPTGKDVKAYTVWYKVQGDGNHNDSAAASVDASIVVNTVTNPTITVTPPNATYNGKKQEPTVTVRDDAGLVIDGSEYTIAYSGDMTNVGTYTLTITGSDAHYSFTATAAFEILPADQTPLTITGKREKVCYGDTIQLGTEGGDGAVTWSVGSSTIATIDTSGLLKITGVGPVTVTATSTAPGYEDKTATWPFYADKKAAVAVVTAEDRAYTGDTTATLTVTISGLASGDNASGVTAAGHFTDKNVGTNKTVIVDSITFPSNIQEKYDISPVTSTTASIFKADVTSVTAPEAKTGLTYTGDPQALVTAGSVTGGTMEYSLDGNVYSAGLPTGTGAGDYEIWYRVKGDGNHNDVDGTKLADKANIAQQNVTAPTIEFNPTGASYDGKEHKPAVTVKDASNRVIPDSEYTVTYSDTDWKSASTATVKHIVTVTNKTGGNYNITEKEQEFTILVAGQSPLSITNKPGAVRYGDSFSLSATGGSGNGKLVWSITGNGVAQINQDGLVKVLKSGSATVTVKREADGGYGETTDTWSFNAEKKTVTPIVTAKDKEYDGTDGATLVISWKDGDLLGDDTITLNLTGKFADEKVGTNKTVTITGTAPENDQYNIKIPQTTTASIIAKAAILSGTTATELEYNGSVQDLVSGVTAQNGRVVYSRDGGYYVDGVPQETNAGKYTVYYKAKGNTNYADSDPVRVDVTIKPKTVTSPTIELSGDGLKQDASGYYYEYDGTAKVPNVVVKDGSTVIPIGEYMMSYSNNTLVSTDSAKATVTISNAPGGNYVVNGSKTFAIKAGAPALTAEPQPRNLTYNGREQTLVTRGTAVNGHMEYSFDEYDDYSTTLLKGTDAGTYEVWYKVVGDDGTETLPESVIAEIKPKTAAATVTLADSGPFPYTGNPITPGVTVVVESKTLTLNTDYTTTYSNNTRAGTATVTVQNTSNCNYQFSASITFEIEKPMATFVTDKEPKAITGLKYNGKAQKLVSAGEAEGGIVLYSLDTITYSGIIPTGIEKGEYFVYAMVRGDSTHKDSDVLTITAKIDVNDVQNPTITLPDNSFSYTGKPVTPAVTVVDDSGNVIPASEYTVSYTNNTNVGTATVTVTSRGSNYSFTATANFQIVGAGQTPLAITGKQENVCYGDTLSLGTTGGNGTGAVTWSATGPVTEMGGGQFKVNSSGSVTITATKEAGGGYEAASDTWTFFAKAKPVTAVVTAANKPYDGTNTATLTVTISSGLVGSDAFSATAEGHFADTDVGTNKTVVIDRLNVSDEIKAKYDISHPDTVTASITPKPATVTGVTGKTGLTYNGSPQVLLANGGTADGGTIMYSVDGGVSYSYDLPTGTDAKSYTVWYKAVASDDNHKDSAPAKAGPVTIAVNTGTPTVLCTPATFQYDGKEKTPTVVVRDSAQNIIPESEYTVTFTPEPKIAVGKYKVTVTDKPGGNYEFSTPVTKEEAFEIVAASQNPLSIVTDKPTDVHYGDTFRLSAMGGSGSGDIKWSIAESSVATIDSNGVVKVTGTGGFTVKAYRKGVDGYSDSNTDSVPFVAKPKPVTPVVTAEDRPYDGTKNATLKASWPSGALVGTDEITLTGVTGEFETPDAGTGKRVKVTAHTAAGADANKYTITWPESTTASIYKVDAKLENQPVGADLTYDGSAKDLVTGGTTVGGIGKIVYSLTQNGAYSENIPTATAAGKYTVWYKVADSVNYTGIPAASVEAEIKKATPTISTAPTASGTAGKQLSDIPLNGGATDVNGRFAWKDGNITAVSGTEYDVIFTPDDTANYNTVTFEITVTVPSAPSSTPARAPMQTTVKNGAANTVVSAAAGSKLVKEAAANQSDSIVIKPEITGEVTKAQVSIPASTVNQIKNETDAALTVSAPMADVTIPNAALDTLGRTGGTVNVAAEQVEQGVAVTLTAGGKKVDEVPGGLTLSVPAEDAGPGTVAVLVHEDGTRETVRKSTVEDGKVNIPLNGSATVEIVDNSKEFADVPAENWAADAVAFASARELFNGTSETEFSPDQEMSRGMLATVLYNLEGCPAQEAASGFSDVSSDAWYANGVAWAAENGIAEGYENGQFGPDDSITREQFAVMLWKYAGSPEAKNKALDFTDADRASGYAHEALCWAVENGILSGCGNGQLAPGETATRAQAAQMLKKFMENT